MKPIRVLLVDDHSIVRQGMQSLLEPDTRFEVVGSVSNGEEAVRLVAELAPDVVLLDLQMPGMSGVEVCQEVKQVSPDTEILILTAFFDQSLVDACLRAGARGYLLKDAENLHIQERLLEIVQGHAVLDPRAAGLLADFLVGHDPQPDVLTAREMEVLWEMALGLSNKEIGAKLFIAENTVKGHVKEILAKMGVRNRIEAIGQARERGLL